MIWIAKVAGVPLDIEHGIHDGHYPYSVPVSQSIKAFNRLAGEMLITDDQTSAICNTQTIPQGMAGEAITEKRAKPVL